MFPFDDVIMVMVGNSTYNAIDNNVHATNGAEVLLPTGNKTYLNDDGDAIIKYNELNDLDDNEVSGEQYFSNFSKRRDGIFRLPWA